MIGRAFRRVVCAIAASACVIASASATVVPSDKEKVKPLDGTWRFKLEQAKGDYSKKGETDLVSPDYPKDFEPFYKSDYKEAGEWHDIKVPGNWEMPGYSPATYNQPDNASGFYRLEFDVPKEWDGQTVKVNFDGVQNGAEIWINGQPAKVDEPSWGRENYHEGGWTAFQADLTPHVKFGQKNLLAIRVTKNTKSVDLDTGDYFFLGGVHRPVTLFAVPKNHLDDLTIQTKLLDADKAEVKAIAKVAGDAKVRVKIDGIDNTSETTVVEHPKLWSAEHPNLYTMHVEVLDGDKVTETVTQRFGIREVTIKDSVLLLNGKPIKMAGICRHDVSANDGTAVGPELWRKDIEMMKAANINAIRTSHYPYGKGFYDLCDELGMYVVDELPYCWTPTNDKEMQPAFLQRARETVRRDKNHPCVLVWTIGNENKDGQNLQAVADLVKQLDATRPRAVSRMLGSKYHTELSDSHYTVPAKIEESAKAAKSEGQPHIYLENPNNWEVRLGADAGAWERWGTVLKRSWRVVAQSETIPGMFLWEWQDRAIVDHSPTKLYYDFPETGINLLKIKGLVDAFRNPRPWLYDVKMVYSPVTVANKFDRAGDAVKFKVENHYSFTNLSELKATWQALRDGKAVAKGDLRVDCAPMSDAEATVTLPGDAKDADALRVDFATADSRDVVAHQFALIEKPVVSKVDATTLPEGMTFPKFNLVTRVTSRVPGLWKEATKYPSTLQNVKLMDATGAPTGEQAEARKLTADVIGGKNHSLVGKLSADYTGGTLHYRLEWSGPAKTVVEEVGWAFGLPSDYDHFSWDRNARWTVYPEKHIGRPTGTATPDSISTTYTKVDRPDQFDFNSTKYDCNWASLTDASGDGLRVEFDPKQRFHCRGGVSEDKSENILYVNQQVSVPNDISTNVVPEYVMTLNPGDVVEGSFKMGAVKH
jgi:beta-galactosidase/beta-glucuronidase